MNHARVLRHHVILQPLRRRWHERLTGAEWRFDAVCETCGAIALRAPYSVAIAATVTHRHRAWRKERW